MLQHSAVIPQTLGLLKHLMLQKSLKDFKLGGGTALALQLGHRLSIDIDLFCLSDFNTSSVIEDLEKTLKFDIILQKENSLVLSVYFENYKTPVKVDILKYSYKIIADIIESDGIRLFSFEDIIPMKLSAISNRGAKKDFYDIYFLLNKYKLKDMLDLFKRKFPSINHFHLLKSLTYFTDADAEVNPKLTKKTSWKQVKARIESEVNAIL